MREHRPLALIAALMGLGLYLLARTSHGGTATAAGRIVSRGAASASGVGGRP